MNEEKLLDTWSESGDSIEEFDKAVKELSAATRTNLVRSCDLCLLSKSETSTPSTLHFYMLNPQSLWDVDKSGYPSLKRAQTKRSVFESKNVESLLDEYENKTHLMIQMDGNVNFTSTNLPPTLGLRASLGGDAMLNPSLERDLLVAKQLNNTDEVTAIVRHRGNAKKIYALLSGKYPYVPQTFMLDILNRIIADGILGTAECHHWHLDNQIGEIFIEFPDKANELTTIYGLDDELIPGLYIAKSDTGECSITVRATWRIGNSIIVLDEFRRKHSGKIDVDDILENIDKTVFSKYTKLPEVLCDLMGINITDPAWKGLSATKFEAMNKKAVEAIIKSVFKQIGLVEATTKKIEKGLFEALSEELDYSQSFTAYDIAIMIMQLPERKILGLSDAYKTPLAKACGKAAFCKYEIKESSKIRLAV